MNVKQERLDAQRVRKLQSIERVVQENVADEEPEELDRNPRFWQHLKVTANEKPDRNRNEEEVADSRETARE